MRPLHFLVVFVDDVRLRLSSGRRCRAAAARCKREVDLVVVVVSLFILFILLVDVRRSRLLQQRRPDARTTRTAVSATSAGRRLRVGRRESSGVDGEPLTQRAEVPHVFQLHQQHQTSGWLTGTSNAPPPLWV